MEVPPILQGPSLTRLLQGAAAGAVVTMIVGFNWGGWTLGSTVEKVAKERAGSAVVAALAPICVDKFRQAADAPANLNELNKINYDWDRSTFVEKGGWATMPGAASADTAVAQACARMLGKLQL
jgi:alpha/beta superfamily hydrolase